MRVKVPFVYEAYVAPSKEADSHRAMVLAAADLDLREVAAGDMIEAMTYRTVSGSIRTVRAFDGGLFEVARDLSVPVKFRDSRAAEANYFRRHGYLGEADRRGRCMTEEMLSRFDFQVDSQDRAGALRAVEAGAGDHVVCEGRVWLRLPEPVLVVQSYDADGDPHLFHFLRAQGAPGRKGVFVSLRSADPRQNSDGIARAGAEEVFNVRELDRARRHAASLAEIYETHAHVSVEAESRRLSQPFVFRHDRSAAIRNAELAELADDHVDRFVAGAIRHAGADAIAAWIALRDAYEAATASPRAHRERMSVFEMDADRLRGVASRLRDFALAAGRDHLDALDLKDIARVVPRWIGTDPAPEPTGPAMRP